MKMENDIMNYCETCKHWKFPHREYALDDAIIGGECTHEKLCEDWGSNSYKVDALVYSYSEGGDFWTGPKFGCVHHEEKI